MLSNDTLKTIKIRRSVRNFKDEQIKVDELQIILDAGVCAPYANENSRHFTVIQNKEWLDRLNCEAKEIAKQIEGLQQLGNNKSFHIFYHAPTVIIVSGKEGAIAIESDCAAANQNMLIAAESIGIGSCWMGLVLCVFNSNNVKEYSKELGIPEGFKPYAAAAFGYKNIKTTNRQSNIESSFNIVK